MNFLELGKMSDKDALDVFKSIPYPSCAESINTDPQSMESILRDFSMRKISNEDREALRIDLNKARGYASNATQ